jgi:hypothetical protein
MVARTAKGSKRTSASTLAAAERWQMARAIESWNKLEREELKLVSPAEIRRLLFVKRPRV